MSELNVTMASAVDSVFTHASGSQLLMGFTFGALIAISLTGNSLVCVAIYTNQKLRKKENLYFCSLALADALLSILVMPFGAVDLIASHWPFGGYCKYWMCLDILFVTASILHLAAISFDRYTHINNPMRYEESMTVWKIGAAIFGVWATAVVVAFLPLAFDTYFHRALQPQTYPGSNESIVIAGVTIYQCEFNLGPVYAILSSLTSFYIPCALMILAYFKLYRYARRHSRAIRKQQEEVRMPLLVKRAEADVGQTSRNGVQPQQQQQHQNQRHRNSKHSSKLGRMDGDQKARLTLGVITGLFLASWLPFFVANIIRSFCKEVSFLCLPDWLFITLTWMGYANSAQNPIIYSIFNRDFRHAFRKILLCGRRLNSANLTPTTGEQAAFTLQNKYASVHYRERRKSEASTVARNVSPCVVIDARARPRSASIVARLANSEHFMNDSNGCLFKKVPDDEPNNPLDLVMPYTKTSRVSSICKTDRVSDDEGPPPSETVWIPREEEDEEEEGRKRSLMDYVYCWHTSLAVVCCLVSAVSVTK